MKPTLFLSDLHLAPERPAATAAFHAFTRGPARAAAAVYILGDLFDAWIGDDQLREPFAADIAASLRRRARAADDGAERRIRRAVGRRPRAASAPAYGGLVARAVAIVADALLVHLSFLVVAASIALIESLFDAFHSGWLTGSLLGAGWAVVVVGYFVLFWSTTGQTPGMRLLSLRVLTGSGGPPSVGRALVRFVGLILAVIPLFAGFAPVLFDDRRRALQDYLAGTAVVSEAESESLAA